MDLHKLCSFAYPNTYGHECGAPATKVGIQASDKTKNGVYFAARCDACAKIKDGENSRITYFEDFDPARHVNQWL